MRNLQCDLFSCRLSPLPLRRPDVPHAQHGDTGGTRRGLRKNGERAGDHAMRVKIASAASEPGCV
jgi:hypothetical protein